ncbi:adenylate cyclase 10 [Fistulifera solaris]|uniref:Adenylate cyclase 10 n=1 Tax=Fistulifera solaris TaxID=1519565 RepID=A0A1Z5JQS2_FISSO|nr:adenylate cyclase 10 [Fistulifera solaris]|eukprot:GAX16256.1 adenylate cyclase 10 [Fistulifera solaris]
MDTIGNFNGDDDVDHSESHANSSSVDETTGRSISTLDYDRYFVEESLLDGLPKYGNLLGVDLMASENGSLWRSETSVGEVPAFDVLKKDQPMNGIQAISVGEATQSRTTGSSNVDDLRALLQRIGDKPSLHNGSKNVAAAPRKVDSSEASQEARAVITRLQSLITHSPPKIQSVEKDTARRIGEGVDDESVVTAQTTVTFVENQTMVDLNDSSSRSVVSENKPGNSYSQIATQTGGIEINSGEMPSFTNQPQTQPLQHSDDLKEDGLGENGLPCSQQSKDLGDFEDMQTAEGSYDKETNHGDNPASRDLDHESIAETDSNRSDDSSELEESFESDEDELSSGVDNDGGENFTSELVETSATDICEAKLNAPETKNESKRMMKEIDEQANASVSSFVEIKTEGVDADDDEEDSDSDSDPEEGTEEEDEFNADDDAFLPNEYLQTPNLPANPMNLDQLLEDCNDYSDSSDDSEYTDSSEGISYGSSDGDSEDDMSDDEYDDLMSSMPIALGRSSEKPPRVPVQESAPPTSAVPEMPFGGGEGLDLSMLANLRTELQKVGTMIAFNKEGEKFVRRAHILASINNLASNIPACVISHLGQEIRDQLLKKEAKSKFEASRPNRRRINGMADVSSNADSAASSSDADSIDSSFSDQNRSEDRGPRRRLVRRISSDSLDSASGESASVSVSTPDSGENSCSSLDDFLGANNRPSRRSSFSSSMSWSAQSSSEDDDGGVLPAIATFEGALMFVDISGFTKLSTVLDPEKLSKVINSYFQKIVEMIYQYSGDIQKFAELIGSTVDCLNIHLGLGFGQMNGIHVGDNRNRREYLYIGDAIDQATTACDRAKLGEAVGSEEFISIISQQCGRQKLDPENALLVADRSGSFFDTSRYSTKVRNAKSRGVTEEVDGLEADDLIEYRRLMSLYVHPVVVSNDIAAANDFESAGLGGSVNDKQKEEAELRSVYVMFIELHLPINLSGDLEQDTEVIHLLNDVMNLVTNKLKHYSGHLRQFIVDDKGFIMIATFGLRGSTFPNLVTERALPATMLIQKALEVKFGVKAKIGATFGDVYCGAVGGSMRHEYAVMGPSVNLAARLMHSPDNPGVLVDNRVRQVASRSYAFEALPAIKAKGYSEPVPIFVPMSVSERTWGTFEPNFVGREKEIREVVQLAHDTMISPQSESKFILADGVSGMGKTSFLVHTLESIRQQLELNAQKYGGVVFINHICLDSEMLVHFATFQTIFARIMRLYALSSNDSSSNNIVEDDSESQSSDAHEPEDSQSKLIESIRGVGRDIQAPPDLVKFATRYLLESNADLATRKSPPKKAVAAFLANAFLRCIEDVGLVVIAIDDVHFTDELTWVILKRILDYANNVILIGTSPVEKSMFRVGDYFWEIMENHFAFSGRFLEIHLGPLTEDEIRLLISKKLGIKVDLVSPDLLHEVMLESGGMPQFAMNVLTLMVDATANDESARGDTKQKLTSDIILHRVDALDVEVRSTLNIAAVLGDKFALGDLVRVLMAGADSQEKDVRKKVASSLKVAVLEGILVLHDVKDNVLKGKQADFDANSDSTTFSFFKSTWRTTILGLMLGSRQRDVHRKTAENMELRLSADSSLQDWLKLFVHWKSSGSTHNAAKVALSIGSLVEETPEAIESIKVFESSLGMFGWQNTDLEENCGFSSDILSVLAAEDIADIIRLSVGLGMSQEACDLRHNSYITFANAIRVMDRARNAQDIKDRSIIFPAYMGLSRAFSDGKIEQDSKRCYEQAMLYRLLEETRRHGRRVHHIHSLFLQMILFARIGDLEKAVAAQSVIRTMYKPIKHTTLLRKAYGFDTGAASFSLCAYYHEMLGNRRQAQSICRSILKRVVPIIDSGPSEAFLVLYPLLFVLKYGGYSVQAKEILQLKLLRPFGAARQYVEKQPYYGEVVEAMSVLLELTSKAPINDIRFNEIGAYVINRAVSKFGSEVNIFLGRLGRCGDSIIAEICLEMAKSSQDPILSDKMARYGLMVSSFAASFNRRQGLLLALANIEGIRTELQKLGSTQLDKPPNQ